MTSTSDRDGSPAGPTKPPAPATTSALIGRLPRRAVGSTLVDQVQTELVALRIEPVQLAPPAVLVGPRASRAAHHG